MSDSKGAGAFSPRLMIALVLVGLFALSGATVLTVYAPDLRRGDDGGSHALSRSAIGYAGMVKLLKVRGTPVVVARAPIAPSDGRPLRVLTPSPVVETRALMAYDRDQTLLVVLPKWAATADPLHPGWVGQGVLLESGMAGAPAHLVQRGSSLQRRMGVSKPKLRGSGVLFEKETFLPLGPIDRLQTVSGEGWTPALVDEEGRMVLGVAKDEVTWLLTDPDLLNTQGLKHLDNARAGLAILDALRDYERGVAFDVALNGYDRPRNMVRLLFEPPMVGGTLCAVAAALLMGLHAVARFGPVGAQARALAFGKRALIDNSADLIRQAHKEHELVPLYAALTEVRVARATGERDGAASDRTARLMRIEGARRPTETLETLNNAAQAAKSRGDALSVAARLFQWKSEMTRDRG